MIKFRMRRALASLLLAAFGFPLIAPVLLAGPASDLPTCCRRNGKHHCATADTSAPAEMPAGPVWQAAKPTCPLYPKAGAIPAYSTNALLGAAPRVAAPNPVRVTIARPGDTRPLIISRSSIRKRGPPTNLT